MPFFKGAKSRASERREKKSKGSKVSKDKIPKVSAAAKRLRSNLTTYEIESSSDDEELHEIKRFKASQDDDDDRIEQTPEELETAEEKKERLAKKFIEELREQKAQKADDEGGRDLSLELQLREEVLESEGRFHRKVAHQFNTAADNNSVAVLKCKKFQWQPITCICINHKDDSIFSSSLDGSIVKYSLSGERLGVIKSSLQNQKTTDQPTAGHSAAVMAIAVSTDGKYLVSGDSKGWIFVWDPSTLRHLDSLKKHRAAVTSLVFQRNTHDLYSGSSDRMVMEWSMDEMTYVSTLGGHTCGVLGVDAMYRQACISVAGADAIINIYDVVEDKRYEYKTKQMSVDGVKLLNENTFISYGQDGSLCHWSTNNNRPLQQLKVAHGYRKDRANEPHWITAITTLVNTDLVATGSTDGLIRLWRVDNRIHSLARIPIPAGVVNSLEFTADGSALVVALARSHKHGRWYVEKTARNSVLVIKFPNVKIKAATAQKRTLQIESDDEAPDSGVEGSDELKIETEEQEDIETDSSSEEDEAEESLDEKEELNDKEEEDENLEESDTD